LGGNSQILVDSLILCYVNMYTANVLVPLSVL